MTGIRRRAPAVLAGVAAVLFAAGAVPAPASAAPGPPSAPQYWFDDWNVFGLWSSGARGQGRTIAEIDTGVNAKLPELQGRIVRGTDLGQGGSGKVDRESDAFGHGTAMASIMVARPGLLGITGLAPDAKLMPIAVPLNGTTDAGRPDRLSDAIRYAADHGANIISMSLGGKRDPSADSESCPDDEQAAIFHALRKGAVVVASVGNTGPTRNTIEEPGVCLGVVSVGAVDSSGQVADFSAREPYLTLVAPGVGVPSLSRVAGQAYSGDGTSQATAIASAALALVWSRYPKLSGRQVVARVLATLDGRRTKQSSTYGYGTLDLDRAVTASVPTDARNPLYDAAAPFLERQDALETAPTPHAPQPVPTHPLRTGGYAVGSSPRVTGRVQLGIGLAAGGLLALLVLCGVGVAGRRRRAASAAAPGFAERQIPAPPAASWAPPAPWPPPDGYPPPASPPARAAPTHPSPGARTYGRPLPGPGRRPPSASPGENGVS